MSPPHISKSWPILVLGKETMRECTTFLHNCMVHFGTAVYKMPVTCEEKGESPDPLQQDLSHIYSLCQRKLTHLRLQKKLDNYFIEMSTSTNKLEPCRVEAVGSGLGIVKAFKFLIGRG